MCLNITNITGSKINNIGRVYVIVYENRKKKHKFELDLL